MAVTVDQLLEKPFSQREFEEKRNIVLQSRPTPSLSITKNCKDYDRHFNVSHYERVQWLCGCPQRNKLFCWPCILFATEKGTWCSSGFDNLSSLTTAIRRHERSQTHIHSVIKMKTFGKTRIDESLSHELKASNLLHNEKVRYNREIMRRLIDCVCFLGKQELSFRSHDEEASSSNRGNYIELLSLISDYDPMLKNHLENSSVFSGLSSHIQNDLIQCITSVINQEIKDEIKSAEFVSPGAKLLKGPSQACPFWSLQGFGRAAPLGTVQG